MKQKAIAYLLVSGKGQITGDGFPRQREAIAALATAAGIEVVQWFEERGVSGKTEWDDRPAWVDMIASLNGVDTIIVERLDRLSRDLGVQEWIMRDLRKRKITLMSTAEPDLGETDPTRVLFRQIMGAIAQYDRTMIVMKLRGARKRKAAIAGRCEGRKPYGTKEGEAALVAVMSSMRAQDETFDAIADRLNTSGSVTRYGRPWRPTTVAKILRRQK